MCPYLVHTCCIKSAVGSYIVIRRCRKIDSSLSILAPLPNPKSCLRCPLSFASSDAQMPTYHPYLNLTAPIFNGSINLDLTLSSQFEPSPLPSRASSKHTSMEGVRTAYTGLEKPSRVYGKGGGRRDTATSLLPLQGRRSGIFSFLNLKRTPSASSSAKQRAPLEHGEDTLVIRDISDSTSMSSVSLDSNRPPTKEVGTNSKAGKILGIIIPVRSPSVTVQIESDAEEDESDGGLTTQTSVPSLLPKSSIEIADCHSESILVDKTAASASRVV